MDQREICKENTCITTGIPSIRVHGLSVKIEGKPILEDIHFETQPCSLTALIGPSGCGKSTFLSCLNRMIDFVPGQLVTGNVHILGKDIFSSQADLLNLRRQVGMIFQKPTAFPTTILKNITLTLKYNGHKNKANAYNLAEASLREVGLWDEVKDRLNSHALSLSGGQQQRLCIARAIAIQPKVILLDEPCSSLDPVSTQKIEELLLSLRNRYTVVIVTHNLGQARRIADRTGLFWLVNSAGKLIEYESTSTLFSQPRLADTAAFISGQVG